MTRILIAIVAPLVLSVPAALAVPPAGKGKPDANRANAFGKCVSKLAKKATTS